METEYSSMHPNPSVHWRTYEQTWQKKKEGEKCISGQNSYAPRIAENKNEYGNILRKLKLSFYSQLFNHSIFLILQLPFILYLFCEVEEKR